MRRLTVHLDYDERMTSAAAIVEGMREWLWGDTLALSTEIDELATFDDSSSYSASERTARVFAATARRLDASYGHPIVARQAARTATRVMARRIARRSWLGAVVVMLGALWALRKRGS